MTVIRLRPTRIALSGVLLAACGPSDRERDCADVHAILEPAPPAPRRTWSYDRSVAIRDEAPFERLRKMQYRDPAVRDAVLAMTSESGIQSYTPYRVESAPPTAADRLGDLCGFPRAPLLVE